jgi:hypothetical protein
MDDRFLPLGVAGLVALAAATFAMRRHSGFRPWWVLELILATAWALMLAAVHTGYEGADEWIDCGSGGCTGLPSIAPWILFLTPLAMAAVLILGGFSLRSARRERRDRR